MFSRMSALYFSFVTLATLGYGDIVPRTDVARGLAIVEGVGGQLFLAVMVARLVSLYGRGSSGPTSTDRHHTEDDQTATPEGPTVYITLITIPRSAASVRQYGGALNFERREAKT